MTNGITNPIHQLLINNMCFKEYTAVKEKKLFFDRNGFPSIRKHFSLYFQAKASAEKKIAIKTYLNIKYKTTFI